MSAPPILPTEADIVGPTGEFIWDAARMSLFRRALDTAGYDGMVVVEAVPFSHWPTIRSEVVHVVKDGVMLTFATSIRPTDTAERPTVLTPLGSGIELALEGDDLIVEGTPAGTLEIRHPLVYKAGRLVPPTCEDLDRFRASSTKTPVAAFDGVADRTSLAAIRLMRDYATGGGALALALVAANMAGLVDTELGLWLFVPLLLAVALSYGGAALFRSRLERRVVGVPRRFGSRDHFTLSGGKLAQRSDVAFEREYREIVIDDSPLARPHLIGTALHLPRVVHAMLVDGRLARLDADDLVARSNGFEQADGVRKTEHPQ